LTTLRPEPRDTSRPLRCAVVGVGHMGSLHASKYAAAPEWELVAVVDIDRTAAERAAAATNVRALGDYRALLGEVDAVSIAVPTPIHHRVASEFLAAGAHVLVEKPITQTLKEADDLIRLAGCMDRTLQVGHIERFNGALMALDLEHAQPRFIEAVRIAPFNPRGSDVSVVLDLMIHDIDLILDMVDSDLVRVDATGSPVLSDDIDIASARLEFASGCVANITASRVSQKVERKMRLFLRDSYASIDFHQQTLRRHRIRRPGKPGDAPEVLSETARFTSLDALETQLRQFAHCIHSNKEPPTSGRAARRALAVAAQIGTLLER
jgi:predicted dehydrogenase